MDNVSILMVPTGVGASIGGYAGDASCIARRLGAHSKLIVNPNVVNAACFSGVNENMYYVEGAAICALMRGDIGLTPAVNNKIGLVFDKSIPENVLNVHINTINAVKTVYGVDVIGYEITAEPVGVEYGFCDVNASSGSVLNPQTLINACEKLVIRGAEAIGVVCYFDESTDADDDYANGIGVDVIGGVEAVISHFLTKKLLLPIAHAPAFSDLSIIGKIVNPKVSAEYITPTFLPCILLGLQNAPQIKTYADAQITFKNVENLIIPYNALGSSVVFDSIEKGIRVLAVRENKTVLNVDKKSLNLKTDGIMEIETYEDCIKYL